MGKEFDFSYNISFGINSNILITNNIIQLCSDESQNLQSYLSILASFYAQEIKWIMTIIYRGQRPGS